VDDFAGIINDPNQSRDWFTVICIDETEGDFAGGCDG
jgi:hypothetical protein